jgi:midasin
MRTFWWDLFHLVDSTNMEEAIFQIHLTLGRTDLVDAQNSCPTASDFLAQQVGLLQRMSISSGLTTGKSMELIWEISRPPTVSSIRHLDSLMRLESLADRFDARVFPLRGTLDELCRVRYTFCQAIRYAIVDNGDIEVLTEELEVAIQTMEAQEIYESTLSPTPFFKPHFEAICQYFGIAAASQTSEMDDDICALIAQASLFAERPTRKDAFASWQQHEPSGNQRPLLSIDSFAGESKDLEIPRAIQHNLHLSLAGRLDKTHSIALGQLDQFRAELSVLSQLMAIGANTVCANQQDRLQQVLAALLKDLTKDQLDIQGLFDTNSPLSTYLLTKNASMVKRVSASQAWIHFALSCIFAYVPDRPFDPALKYTIQRDRLAGRKAKIEANLQALQLFERYFSGQSRNLRYSIMEKEYASMSADIPELQIPRPPTSQLSSLQAEFNIVLQIARSIQMEYLQEDHVFDQSVRQNLAQMIMRLQGRYRAYDDIVVPLIGFLQCLSIGLFLADLAVLEETQAHSDNANALAQLKVLQNSSISLVDSSEQIENYLYRLSQLAVVQNVETAKLSPFRYVDECHQIFAHLYDAWKGKMFSEQEKYAKKSNLYAYRGGQDAEDEDDEEEFNSLFPDYEQDGEPTTTNGNGIQAPRSAAIRISTIHAQVFCGQSDPTELVADLFHHAGTRMRYQSTLSPESSAATLPYLFFTFQEKINTLDSGLTNSTNYNIYTDPNVAEAKKLMLLVGKIQRHFRSLLSMEFEHSTVDDVIRIGNEILAFQHTEPVAKFMTKTEKMYEAMNEWERVASKALSASGLYDDLTSLIISWRRLELTTWMRLYDLEMAKCVEDAKSWWFVAYENIIAVPESLSFANEPLRLHGQELLKTLETFFTTATIGQYQERLQLVAQFQHHLQHLIVGTPELTVIHTALANFVAYYIRFKQPVADTLAKSRQKLEKDVKEVVQLASWKDTNIASLRQSAKTSHQKLFRLVRKFRAILNRPVTSIIEQGPPDEISTQEVLDDETLSSPVAGADNQVAFGICAESFFDWDEVPSRFKNTSATVSLMHRIGQGPGVPWDGTGYVNDFISNLQISMAELQKATPTILNDETKTTVKHLRTRKRTLFAQVLKKLRQMGFQYNLSVNLLSLQDTSAAILAALPSLDYHDQFPGVKIAEYHFHKTLSMMGQVRNIQREHSGDLTPAEVARSTGFLESILQRMLLQRKQLASAIYEFDQLQVVLDKVKNFGNVENQLRIAEEHHTGGVPLDAVRTAVTWLAPISKVILDVVSAQCQLGKIEAADVLEAMKSWTEKIEVTVCDFNSLPGLPESIHNTSYQILVSTAKQMLDSFRIAILGWTESFPMLAPVLDQLLTWTILDISHPNGHSNHQLKPVSTIRDDVFSSIDIILASVQDLDKSASAFSVSTEEVGWLVNEDACRSITLASLHVKNVTRSLLDKSNALSTLTNEELPVAAALFSVLSPILQQYLNLAHHHLSSYVNFHSSICRLSNRLSASFIQIGTKGFCTPADKTTNNDGQEEKLEGGTGLGEGEGAEDISKDIGDDEDLTELAQEPDTKTDKDEIEDEKDAVDMADAEMEGEMGDVPEKGEDEEENGSGDENEGDEEMEEEAGGVDDLGPSTVDEKMWDDGDKPDPAEKDKEDDQGQGTEQDEQVAGQDGKKEQDDKKKQEATEEETAEQDAGADEGENVGQDQPEKTDQHLEQGDTLDLPDDLDMDGKSTDGSDDDSLGDLDDLDEGDTAEGMQLDEEDGGQEGESEDGGDDQGDDMADLNDEFEENAETGAEADEIDNTNETEEVLEDKENEGVLNAEDDKANAAEDALPSDTHGLGLDQNNQQDEPSKSKNATQQEDGTNGEEKDNNQGTEGEQGANGVSEKQEAVGRNDELQDASDTKPFKKLGDTLERWYNQQRQILQPTDKEDAPQRERKQDVDMGDADFEHLENEQSQAEAQALGAASADQARALDEDQAIATNDTDMPQKSFVEDDDSAAGDDEDIEMENANPSSDHKPNDKQEDGQAKTFIGEPNSRNNRESKIAGEEADSEQEIEEVDEQLSSVHLDQAHQFQTVGQANARSLWQEHELNTRTLAATLTEQLRLILAPTMATKLRGDFRTGKRLNIKRIIPYIASSYKRDKIWMRRSVPSKRAYQIMIALDDSKSMAEGGSKELAFETLALVAKSLSMLESGELCVVGFGKDVKIAHPFDRPFTDDAGVEVLSQFTFEQEKTDVRKLVNDGINIFQEARAKASGSASELWQLMLVVSDAICDDADAIRRLVRRSQEEKIMIVFVVVDAGAREGEEKSIMKMESVGFEPDDNGEMRIIRHKYMADIFPFRWWIVVRDVGELPGVLATALRQWFAEVVDSG